jgi:hypothetical protein
MIEPFEEEDDVMFHLIFKKSNGDYEYEADTGKSTQVYNTKVSGISIGNVNIMTKQIRGSVIGDNIDKIAALTSEIEKEHYDNHLWEIKWLGQVFPRDFIKPNWMMKVDSESPQNLWFLVFDTEKNIYLTGPIDTASAVDLDISTMEKIIEAPSPLLQTVIQASPIRSISSSTSVFSQGNKW